MVTVRSLSLFRRPPTATRAPCSLGQARGVVERRNWWRRVLQPSAPVAIDGASHALAVRRDAAVSNMARPWIDHVRYRVDVLCIARARRDSFDALQIGLEKFVPEIVVTKADEIAGTNPGGHDQRREGDRSGGRHTNEPAHGVTSFCINRHDVASRETIASSRRSDDVVALFLAYVGLAEQEQIDVVAGCARIQRRGHLLAGNAGCD